MRARRRRYVFCLIRRKPNASALHREQLLIGLDAELSLLRERKEDHPKAAARLRRVRARKICADDARLNWM
jgi:hypothetical protein